MDIKKLPDVSEFVVSTDGTVDMADPINADIARRTRETIEHNKAEIAKFEALN